MISQINPNFNRNNSNKANTKNVAFGHIVEREVLSSRAVRLIKKLEDIVNAEWKTVKSSKYAKNGYPTFPVRKSPDAPKALLTPLYNSFENSYLLEVNHVDYIEKININRRNPEKFIYERLIPTKTGSATVKSYDSSREVNSYIDQKVSGMIEEYVSAIIKPHGNKSLVESKLLSHIVKADV